MRLKRRRRRKPSARFPLRLLAFSVTAPLAIWGLWNCASLLGKAGENVAVLSAALALPDGSAPILRERFRAEIYNPEGEHATGEREQGIPLEEVLPRPEYESSPEHSASGADPVKPQGEAPRIPEEYAAPILSENFAGAEGDTVLRFGEGLIKNETSHSEEDLREILSEPWPVRFADSGEPQVLIVHTHATEAFERYDSDQYDVRNTWRSTDNRNNMVAVGDTMAQVLEERGIPVLHDTTQHDYPSYNGSYDRSAETIRAYLEEYPSIKVVLDLHRDAMQREDAIVKPVAVVGGQKAAQIMIISACDDGAMGVTEWRQNLRFAASLQNHLEQVAPGITRPVYFCYRKYNMDLTTGSLLLEFGSNANTLEEAVYSATLAGEALANLMEENRAAGEEPGA